MEQGNGEWHQYLLSLSKAIAGNAEQMARVLDLVQQGFLKGLEGRFLDLGHLNGVYYDEEEVQGGADLASLKQAEEDVDHEEDEPDNAQESEAQGKYTKIKELLLVAVATKSSGARRCRRCGRRWSSCASSRASRRRCRRSKARASARCSIWSSSRCRRPRTRRARTRC